MTGNVVRGLLLLVSGSIVLLGGLMLGFSWPWPIGAVFLVLALIELLRAARYSRNRLPDDVLFDEAERLEKNDPIAAEQLVNEGLRLAAAREERELAELRSQAHFDARAAKELRQRLNRTLQMREAAKRDFAATMARDPRLPSVLRNLEEANQDTRRLLEELQVDLRRLEP